MEYDSTLDTFLVCFKHIIFFKKQIFSPQLVALQACLNAE